MYTVMRVYRLFTNCSHEYGGNHERTHALPAAEKFVRTGDIPNCRGTLPEAMVTVTMPLARIMVFLDGLMDNRDRIKQLGLVEALDIIDEALKRTDPHYKGDRPPIEWKHPMRFNRNSIALAALQTTLAVAGQGAQVIEDDLMCAALSHECAIVLTHCNFRPVLMTLSGMCPVVPTQSQ